FFVHRTSVFGEVLYMRPRNAEVSYALPSDIAGFPPLPILGNQIPAGPVDVIDPKYDVNFRIGANIALDKGSSIRGQFTRLRFSDEDSAAVPPGTVLRS